MDGRLIIENKRVETQEKIESLNPATLNPVGEICLASEKECRQAIQAAEKAFPSWKELPHRDKKKIFNRAKEILLQRKSEVAGFVAAEKGTPFPESLSVEVQGALEALDYYGRTLKKAFQPKKMKHQVILFSHKKSHFRFQPLGVTLVISPWNFPFRPLRLP